MKDNEGKAKLIGLVKTTDQKSEPASKKIVPKKVKADQEEEK